MGKLAATKFSKMSTEALGVGGMVDMLLKSGEAALTGDEASETESESNSSTSASSKSTKASSSSSAHLSSSSSSSSKMPSAETFPTLGGLVQGLTHPKLTKAVDKPDASGANPGAMDFFHGGISYVCDGLMACPPCVWLFGGWRSAHPNSVHLAR